MEAFDYIIVGAGSAGCVLANRLSADPSVRVLLLEAGPRDWHPFIHMPAGVAKLVNRKGVNWDYNTEPEAELAGRRLWWPRGKVLGGSSSINAMCYIRGHRDDYDEWAALGATGWDWDSVLPWFRHAETNSRGATELHGGNGPLAVSDHKYRNPLSAVFLDAAQSKQVIVEVWENPPAVAETVLGMIIQQEAGVMDNPFAFVVEYDAMGYVSDEDADDIDYTELLAEMPEDYRVVFSMRDMDGLSNAEVADVLGISVAAVKSRLHRSRLYLRDRLTLLYGERNAAGAARS